MKKLYTLVLFCFFIYNSEGQGFMRPNEWKKYRREVFFNFGVSNFLGDLGGRDKKGSDYTPLDLNFDQSRISASAGVRYKVQRWMNVAAKLSYLTVKGDDASTEDIYRHMRNLNFKSNIFEVSGRAEFGYQSTRRGGNKYGLRKSYGRMRNITHNLFGFIGLGAFYFNPYGRTAAGDYIALRPLHTEGQGLPGGPSEYSNFSVCIPIGAYYKMTFNKTWSFGIEFCYRKTFTDYIDDVGTRYYNPAALGAAYGPLSVQMADPNLYPKNIPGYNPTGPAADGTPAQRGDKQKDAYLSLELTVSYTFKQQRKSARLRSKF